jgi:hypothetical protein
MNKLLLLGVLLLAFICGCANTEQKMEKKIGDAYTKQVEKGDLSLAEYEISKKLVVLITPTVIGIGVGIVLIFCGLRIIGLGVLTASMTCMILIITLAMYMTLIAIIGVIVLLIAIFFLFKAIRDKDIATKDLVNSVTMVKTFVPEDKKGILKETLNDLQSKVTKKKVIKIRE